MGLGLNRSSFVMVIFGITVITLIGFSSHDAFAATNTLSDGTTCAAAPFLGSWDASTSTCTVSSFSINSGDSVVIDSGITLDLSGDIGNSAFSTPDAIITNNGIINIISGGSIGFFIDITNTGTINNAGHISNDLTITNSGTITNTGTVFDAGRAIINSGTITNTGTMTLDVPITNSGTIINSGTIKVDDGTMDNSGGTITNNSGGTINFCCTTHNSGTITNNSGGTINHGTINNDCGGIFTNLGTYTGGLVNICPLATTTVPSATGNGPVTFSTSAGHFSTSSAISQSSLSIPPPPGSYPFGFFSWTIIGLTPGQTTTVTMTYPGNPGTVYEKLINGVWVTVPAAVTPNGDGTFTVTLTLTDGGTGDADQTVNSQISDPGGMGTFNSTSIPEFPFSFSLVIIFVAVTAVYLGIRQKMIPGFKSF